VSRAVQLLRIGAVFLAIGSVVTFVFRISHGDLPTDTGAAALDFVAARPLYPLVHLGDCLGVLIWTVGLVALSGSLTNRAAWVLGLLGSASVLAGAAVHIAEFSIDGYALPTLAATWATAAPADRPMLEFGARLVLIAIGGPSTMALVILWGSTLVLYGLTVKKEGYAPWLGWAGVTFGAAVLVLGSIQFLKPNVVFSGVLLYGGGTIASQLWTLVVAIVMWRRAGSTAEGLARNSSQK
jgi:hypothetical protein